MELAFHRPPMHVFAPPPDHPPPPRLDLRVDDWGFYVNMTRGKFEIYRANQPDLAHLVMMWRTASGELDVHVTYEHERALRPTDKQYESIARFPLAELHALGALPVRRVM